MFLAHIFLANGFSQLVLANAFAIIFWPMLF